MKISATFSRPKIKAPKLNLTSMKNIMPDGLGISIAVFSVGIIVSSVVFVLNENYLSEKLSKYFNIFYLSFSSKTFPEIFCGELLLFVPFFLLMMILGTSAYGTFSGIAVLFSKSCVLGATVSFLFYKYQLKGIEYFLLVFLISKLIIVFDILFISQNCMSSSKKIKKLAERGQSDSFDFKLYNRKCLFAFVVMLLSCLAETISLKIFSPLFTF